MKLDTSKMSRGELIEKIIEYKDYAEKWNDLDKNTKYYAKDIDEASKTNIKNMEIVEQLKKLLGNTTKNPEHCCQAFEYIRDTLQKIVREKND